MREAILDGELEWREAAYEAPLVRVDEVVHPAPWEHWLKMKVEVSQAFAVGGFTDPQGVRVGLGALPIGARDAGDLVFAGKVGTGLGTAALVALRERLDALEIPASPFTRGTGVPRVRVHWVRPEVEVDVAFVEWTARGKLRHPWIRGGRA